MRIIKFFIRFIKNVAASRTAQIFFCVQLILLIIGLSQRGKILPPYHPEYEPALLNFVVTINLPANFVMLLLVLPVAYFLSFPGTFDIENNYYLMIFFVILMYSGWQIQSALVGYAIEKWIQRQKKLFTRNREPFKWTE